MCVSSLVVEGDVVVEDDVEDEDDVEGDVEYVFVSPPPIYVISLLSSHAS